MSDKKLVIKLKYGASARHGKGSQSVSRPSEYEWNYARIAWVIGTAVIAFGFLAYVLSKDAPEPESADEKDIPAVGTGQPEQVLASNPPGNARGIQSAEPGRTDHLNHAASAPGLEVGGSLGGKRAPQTGSSSAEIAAGDAGLKGAARKDGRRPGSAKREMPIQVERAQFSWGIKEHGPTGDISSPAILQPGDSVTLYFYSEILGLQGKRVVHIWSRNGQTVLAREFEVRKDPWHAFSNIQLNSELLGRWSVTIRLADGRNLGEYSLDVLEPGKASN